jgi:hypothetical protein
MSRIIQNAMLALLGMVMPGLPSLTAHAAPLPEIGAVVTMDADFFGCRALDDLARVVNLDWVKNDKAGATAYGAQHCIVLKQGQRFSVADVSVVQGAVCVRQEPRSRECIWTNAQMLKRP